MQDKNEPQLTQYKFKVLLISGGTGSFGNAVLKRFLDSDIREIRIFSRDEKKQDDMRHEYQSKYPCELPIFVAFPKSVNFPFL